MLQLLLVLQLTLTVFFTDLRDIPRKVNKDDNIVVMGGFTARVGCNHAECSLVIVQGNVIAMAFSTCNSVSSILP